MSNCFSKIFQVFSINNNDIMIDFFVRRLLPKQKKLNLNGKIKILSTQNIRMIMELSLPEWITHAQFTTIKMCRFYNIFCFDLFCYSQCCCSNCFGVVYLRANLQTIFHVIIYHIKTASSVEVNFSHLCFTGSTFYVFIFFSAQRSTKVRNS